MDRLLLAEELFLLTHDDDSGKSDWITAIDSGYAGALLLDLAAQDLLRVDEDRVRTSPIGTRKVHPLLVATHAKIREDDEPRKAEHWVSRFPSALKPLDKQLGQSLVERGVLAEERRKVLGLFPTTKWPEADPAPERELRERIHRVLVEGQEPDVRTGLLIALLSPLDLVKSIVEKPDRKAAQKRAEAIAESDLGGAETAKAVKQAVDAIQAALVLAIIIPAATTAAS